jgi:hypothetical protein
VEGARPTIMERAVATHDKRSRPRGDHGAQYGDVDLGPTLNTPTTTAASF